MYGKTTIPKAAKTAFLQFSGINDLGNYEECNKAPYSHYALSMIPMAGGAVYNALCVPKVCTQDAMNELTFRIFSSTKTYVVFSFPEEELDYSLNAGAIITIILIAFVFLVSAIGVAVEMTPLGDKWAHANEDGNRAPLPERKTKWGLFFLSFSLTYNMKKLCQPGNPDDNLKVLNGVRALSAAWVILGHSFEFNLGVPASNFYGAFKLMMETFFLMIVSDLLELLHIIGSWRILLCRQFLLPLRVLNRVLNNPALLHVDT